MRPAIPMQDVVKGLGATGAVAMVGYVFDGRLGATQPGAARALFCCHEQGEKILG